jgi:recombination protein RecA
MMAKEKKEPTTPNEALALALQTIDKTYGKGTVITGNADSVPGVEYFSSGCMSIDKALGGGWAKGRIIEVLGPESAGKSTLCLHAIAEIQKDGGKAAFIDVEHAFDPKYAKQVGVDIETLIFSQPDSGEQALNVVDTLVRTGAVSLVVVDSVAALVSEKELEGEMGDSVMGVQARLMSQAMRKLAGITHNTNTTIIFTNQIRMKIGVMWGNPETTSGGNALKFYASQRVDIRRTGGEKEGDQIVGNKTRIKVVKNKTSPPFKEAEFLIRYGIGIDKYADLIGCALAANIIQRSGSWFSTDGKQIGQGVNQVVKYLHENPEVCEEIKEKLK